MICFLNVKILEKKGKTLLQENHGARWAGAGKHRHETVDICSVEPLQGDRAHHRKAGRGPDVHEATSRVTLVCRLP